jgi:catechol 2,3-dioxygenase-like lactoylglutathione lyase family enzyme
MSVRLYRRQFLKASAAWVASLHVHLLHAAPPPADNATPRLIHLKLHTHKLDELRRFYARIFGLPITADTRQGFTLKSGPSTMEWSEASPGTTPFYHFAWNVPENQFAEAKAWLARRTPLLRDSSNGKDEVHFAAWNAHAVYFRDPAGNIGELIARHTLSNKSQTPFSEQSLQCISEIGLATTQSKQRGADLAKALSWSQSGTELVFVGDDMGYLIVAPVGRLWLPDRTQKAALAPAEVTVQQAITTPIKWETEGVKISGQ